jgi:hypothetical protein
MILGIFLAHVHVGTRDLEFAPELQGVAELSAAPFLEGRQKNA